MAIAVVLRLCRWLPLTAGGDCVTDLDAGGSARLARRFTALLSTLTVLMVFAAARSVLSHRAAVLSAAVLAVSAFHALYAGIIGVDTPLVFWLTTSLACVLRARQSPRRTWLFVAGLCAGLAAATKYPGLLGLGPVLVCLIERRQSGRRDTAAATAIVVMGVLAGALAGCPRCPIDAAAILPHLGYFWHATMVQRGQWAGIDLYPGSPLAHRYVYPLFAALPFMLGWALYGVAVVGVWRALGAAGPLRWYVGSIGVPYFLLMGASNLVPPRWYLPLLPLLAIVTGPVLDDWLFSTRRRWRRAVAVAALAYSLAYSYSLTDTLTFGPQRGVEHWLERHAQTSRKPLTVGYPDRLLSSSDGISTVAKSASLRWRFLPGVKDGQEPDYEGWLARERPDFLIWPSFMETRIRRNYPGGAGVAFLDALESGTLGYRLAATFPTHYLTQEIYARLDPMFTTVWEVGLVSYRIFVRADLLPSARQSD
jgi:hypothetical protein